MGVHPVDDAADVVACDADVRGAEVAVDQPGHPARTVTSARGARPPVVQVGADPREDLDLHPVADLLVGGEGLVGRLRPVPDGLVGVDAVQGPRKAPDGLTVRG